MIHCHPFYNMRLACRAFDDFCYTHDDELARTKETHGDFIAILQNGEEHHFMSEIIYPSWCKGRTYMYDQRLYRSGYPLKER